MAYSNGILGGTGVGSRLVYQARISSIVDKSRSDFRSGGVLVTVEGLAKRFHDNNFQLLGLSR